VLKNTKYFQLRILGTKLRKLLLKIILNAAGQVNAGYNGYNPIYIKYLGNKKFDSNFISNFEIPNQCIY
jgi:hypothetical protein